MSASDSSNLKICTSDSDNEAVKAKSYKKAVKHKIKRTGESLKLNPTQKELDYRRFFNDMNVVKNFSDLIKCTRCQVSFKKAILEKRCISSHPLLQVLFCDTCCEFYGDGNFSLDEDGEDKYCRWCGEGGKIFLCSKCICGFCPKCIKRHFGKDVVKEIKCDDDWICYFCNPEPLWKLRTVCHLAIQQALPVKNSTISENGTPKVYPKRKTSGVNPAQEVDSSVHTVSDHTDVGTVGVQNKVIRKKRKRSPNLKGEGTKPLAVSTTLTGLVGFRGPRDMFHKRFLPKRETDDLDRFGILIPVIEETRGNTPLRASSVDSTDYSHTENTKRRRILTRKMRGKDEEPSKRWTRLSLENNSLNHSRQLSSSDSDENTVEVRSNADSPKSSRSNSMQTRKDQSHENLERFREILKVGEVTSELCLEMCRKIFKKYKRANGIAQEELAGECENLKSMVILMSSSLSTVHNLVIQLQQKCGSKILDSAFQVKGDSSLLKGMSQILREKRVKTSYVIEILNDILNRYPYIEAEWKSFNDLTRDIIGEQPACNSTPRSAGGSPKCRDKETSKPAKDQTPKASSSNSHKVGGHAESSARDSPVERVLSNHDGGKDVRERTPADGSHSERTFYDSDTSTQIFEYDLDQNRSGLSSSHYPNSSTDVGSGGRKDGGDVETMVNGVEVDDRPVDGDEDLQKLYAEAMAVKKMLLKSSSDESLSGDPPMPGDPNEKSVRVNGKSVCRKHAGRMVSTTSKEEQELRRLMNLTSLERKTGSNNLNGGDSSSTKEPEQKTRRASKQTTESDRDANDDGRNSCSDAHSDDFNFFRNHTSGIDFVKENALMLKNFILKTTSSSSETGVEDGPAKKKAGPKQSGDGSKRVVRKNRKSSSWRSSRLLRDSSSDVSSNELESWRRAQAEKKVRKCSEDTDHGNGRGKDKGEGSDVSFKARRLLKKRGPSKVVVSTDEDSDSSSEVEAVMVSNSESPFRGRKNIKKILKKENLQLETKQAAKLENERKRRISERNEEYRKLYPDMANSDRLVLDFNRETKEVLLEVPKRLARALKPHQKEGVKFMWDCCFESVEGLEERSGSGCILAHCMGLGKTLQIITLIYTMMKNNLGVNTVLILCPLNVINNWLDEFDLWVKDFDDEIDVYSLKNCKKYYGKYHEIKHWHNSGGVLVLSYDSMRNLTNTTRMARYKVKDPNSFSEFLLDPGPDLVVCDEGHLLKNEDSALSRSIRKIKTSRRIILTGTPLQNNLLEYHSMIQFIKPNILGTRKEFMNRFVNPIMNGQFEDSTASDVKLMRGRSHVLHKLLDGCIQRFSYSVVTPFLPEKHEYVISIRLTDTQAKLYQHYVDKCRSASLITSKGAKLFSDFHWLQKVWTHPKTLLDFKRKREGMKRGRGRVEERKEEDSDDSVICINPDGTDFISSERVYWEEVVRPEEYEDIRSGGKLVVLFHILQMSRKVGDKVLVFSQSLSTLNLIEYFLQQMDAARTSNSDTVPPEYKDTWVEGVDYFRMDGSTSAEVRSKWCNTFNKEKNRRSRLFLISTRAGGLGINLTGANRVVLFDVSWNPSHDVQSIFRVYRFGQTKPCFIYRFFAEGTMEEKIYARQVTKVSLEKRVLDEHQIERHYTMGNLQALYKYDPTPREKWATPKLPKDKLLAEILQIHKDRIVAYHEHDSLLENKEEEELTEEERKAAWEDFEKEKFLMENELERSRKLTLNHTKTPVQDMDAMTQEVLRMTEMGKMSVPYFTPSFRYYPDSDPPFRVVNVGSMGSQQAGPSTGSGLFGSH